MAIGRNQQESLQKALRGLEVGATGFNPIVALDDPKAKEKIIRELREPGAERIWYIVFFWQLLQSHQQRRQRR